jgi:hypothetical protein
MQTIGFYCTIYSRQSQIKTSRGLPEKGPDVSLAGYFQLLLEESPFLFDTFSFMMLKC